LFDETKLPLLKFSNERNVLIPPVNYYRMADNLLRRLHDEAVVCRYAKMTELPIGVEHVILRFQISQTAHGPALLAILQRRNDTDERPVKTFLPERFIKKLCLTDMEIDAYNDGAERYTLKYNGIVGKQADICFGRL
jgi:hypothetical protein